MCKRYNLRLYVPRYVQHPLTDRVVVFIDSWDLHIQLAIKCILNSNYALCLSLSLSQDATNKVISSKI